MRIYLVRHGETDWNLINRLQGIEDIPLNSNGVSQANECGELLATLPFDCVVSSPLKRAKETARIIAAHCKIPNINIDDRLIERDYGRLSGLIPSEREAFYTKNEAVEIEDFGVLVQRMMLCLLEYKIKYKNVLMVSHGGSINAVLAALSKHRIGAGKTKLKNACISILQDNEEAFDILWYNLTFADKNLVSRGMSFGSLCEQGNIVTALPYCIRQYVEDASYDMETIGCSQSKVLMFDHNMVLKIEPSREISNMEYIMLQWLQDKLPVPKIVKYCCVDGVNYLLMTKIDGEMACSDYYMNHPEETVDLLAKGLRTLWSVSIKDCPHVNDLDNILRLAKDNIDNNRVDIEDCQPDTFGEGGFSSPTELYEYLCNNRPEEELYLVHGDYCLPNIFFANDEIKGFIDLGLCGIADRWQDIALCVRSLKYNLELVGGEEQFLTLKARLFKEIGLEPDEEKIRYYILLDELF